MAGRRELNGILAKARRQAFRVVKREVMRVLPTGWELHFAVGWGLTLFNAERRTVFGIYETAPDRLPRGLRQACELAADYVETFGYDNTCLVGRR